MTPTTLKVESDPRGCYTFLLDRPAKRNALDEVLLLALEAAADSVSKDQSARLVLLRSTSPTFCAGADLNEWADVSPAEASRLSTVGSRAFQALANLPVPTVAVLEGSALGGGLELALACDLRIGTSNARVGFPEPRLGNAPGWGGVARIIDVAGRATARQMLLTGDTLDAPEAHRLGILHRICTPEGLSAAMCALTESIVACDRGTLETLKSMLVATDGPSIADDAVLAGYTATRVESRERKAAFLVSRRGKALAVS